MISGAQPAYLTARAGQMRAGASRAAYVPRETVNKAGTTVGGFVRYAVVTPITQVYTTVTQ